jgi:hypothetical protein
MHDPARVGRADLLLVHTADYVDRFTAGRLTPDEERRLGFPWSESLVERSYRAAGGTSEAARHAIDHGIAMNLAGGTHHAFSDHGEGFCVFNDVAVAIRALQRDNRIARAAVIDLDVHQGNGTHAIFSNDDSVFTFSMHGGRNYPFRKVPGRLDVELPDRTGDDEYLAALPSKLRHEIRRKERRLQAAPSRHRRPGQCRHRHLSQNAGCPRPVQRRPLPWPTQEPQGPCRTCERQETACGGGWQSLVGRPGARRNLDCTRDSPRNVSQIVWAAPQTF